MRSQRVVNSLAESKGHLFILGLVRAACGRNNKVSLFAPRSWMPALSF